jgi:signal transduction histidine kinase
LYTIIMFLIAAWMVTGQRLEAAGWFIVVTVGGALSAVTYISGSFTTPEVVISISAVFVFIPVTASLLVNNRYVLPISLAAAVIHFLLLAEMRGLYPEMAQTNVVATSMSVGIALLTVGFLLSLLRREFDARFEAMNTAIRQETAARAQADEARKRAEEADKAKSRFLANMSHELRTPLNAIIGYDEAMLGGMVGEFSSEQNKLLGHIQYNSRRLLGLIDDILDLAKVEAGSMQVFLSPISPRKIIGDAVDNLRALADRKQIRLNFEVSNDMPEAVLGDVKKLQQIVINLVSNAIKFTTEGGVTVKIALLPEDKWQLKVIDTGIGIPKEAQQTIFEPFQQLDNSETRKYKGTGLGLAITLRFVEALGGTITVDSEIGNGSTFTVTLPRAKAPTVRLPEDSPVVRAQSSGVPVSSLN